MKKPGGGGTTRSPNDIDRLVGENVRRLRIQRSLTLAQLSAELGLSHQQLQKYETGLNRLSAGVLCRVSEILCVPIETLFQEIESSASTGQGRKSGAMDELRLEGNYWLARAANEQSLRRMVEVLRALSASS